MKSAESAVESPLQAPARWEERSTNRVVETGREQILERSRRIVDAASDLLGEQGLDGLTIRAVLKKTRLARRAFYERFAGKDDLMLAVFEHAIRLVSHQYGEQVQALSSPLERLRLIVTGIVLGNGPSDNTDSRQSNRRGAALSREHLRLAESRPHELQAALHPLLTLIEQQLSDGMAAGLVRWDSPQRLAALVYNLVATTVHAELLAHETARPDLTRRTQLAADIWEFCRRAIAA